MNFKVGCYYKYINNKKFNLRSEMKKINDEKWHKCIKVSPIKKNYVQFEGMEYSWWWNKKYFKKKFNKEKIIAIIIYILSLIVCFNFGRLLGYILKKWVF